MPNHAKPNVILRQWEMLRLIPNGDHPGRSVQDLAVARPLSALDERFDVGGCGKRCSYS